MEADPRHSEIVVRDFGLENVKPSKLPSYREEHKRSGGGPAGAGVCPLNGMDVGPPIVVDDLLADFVREQGQGQGPW